MMVRLVLAVAVTVLVGACSGVPRIPGITPYKMDIQQGNFVSQEMVAQLKPGMTREQVRFILGTPLVADIFHADRWDYVYWREAPNGKREERRVALFFSADNKLERIAGDVVSSAAGPSAELQ
jgi:outer membrane protein assembly factor BamE